MEWDPDYIYLINGIVSNSLYDTSVLLFWSLNYLPGDDEEELLVCDHLLVVDRADHRCLDITELCLEVEITV